ncbi:MAG: TonB-dependent receptor plug domain-containing protein [FCB group bacterium]|nr:TonB-dependent receptor plug domain-containing protein [FCB group bacterium]MBL7027635.1 TonB-dependent receptor plug domain-containing protein [Candidatus Neomarinimicrobiota bacterium]MBL7121118.1 TonB-dependent receptor plug domain-containing protein [Candidatus Neomarinimicrobiota bacterium]
MMRLRIRTHSKIRPNLRRGFFYALSAIVILPSLGFSTESNSNNLFLQGQTLDLNGQIIPYVSLMFQESEVFLLSDEYGRFSYSSTLAENDSVFIQRIGYKNKMLLVEDIFRSRTIQLAPDILRMESVEVEGQSIAHQNVTVLGHHTKTQGSVATDHKNMLARIPGISIKSYGGPAGISTLSMDGGPSSHTIVRVNGIDISSSQNGEADLSQLPLPFIESMSYIPYDITQSGDGGIDGVVKLETGDQRTHLNLSQGSFGHRAYDIYLNNQISGFWTSLQVGQRQEGGNYPVNWDGNQSLRENNQLDQKFAALTLRKMIRTDLYWQLTAMSSHQSRGVAGLLWSPDTISHRNDQLTLLGSSLGWIRQNGSSHLHFSARNSDENYVNPYLNVSSDHHLRGYYINLKDERDLGERLELNTDLRYNLDEIISSSTSNHLRNSYNGSLAPTIRILKNIRVTPTLKFHFSPELYNEILNDFQIQIPLNWGPLTQLAWSQGEVFKYPTFNDLYWEPGGNPDLEPEETSVTTLQSRFDFRYMGSLHLQWQKKVSNNLIQWMPVLSYWQPGNVQSATRESRKALWQYDLPGYRFSAFAHHSLIQTLDHERNLPLRYAPEQTSALGFTWTPLQFEINMQYNYISDRISMYGYPEDVIIDATGLWTGSVAHTWNGKLGQLTLVISADNLEDTSYETIKGYPEPGRSYRISTKFSK